MKYKQNQGYLEKHDHSIAKSTISLPHFLHIIKNFTCSVFEKYHLTKQFILYISFDLIFSEKVLNQCRMIKVDRLTVACRNKFGVQCSR